jgi:hypothetical protein
MTATNHALSGALIGAVITQPLIALPLAFASHFVLDAIPHLGFDDHGGHHKAKKMFAGMLLADAFFLSAVMVWLFIIGAPLLVFACLFLAGSPDFIWAYRYIFKEKFGKKPEPVKNLFNRFHARIQTSQTLQGVWVEAPLAVLFVYLLNDKL